MEVKLKHQLEGHQGAIYALTAGINQGSVLSGGADRKLINWDIAKGEGRLIAQSAATVMSVLFIKERQLLLVGQTEGGVHVIDIEKNKEVKYLKGHASYIFDIQLIESKNELIFSCADGSISIWSLDRYEKLFHKQLTTKGEKVRKLAVDKEERRLLVSRGDGTISLIDTKDYGTISEIKLDSPINVARFTKDDDLILVGDKNAHLHLVSIGQVKALQSLAAHYWSIYDLAFNPSANYFATASRDKIVKIWDPENLEVLARLEGRPTNAHTHSVNALFWEDDQHLISAGDDGKLKVWELS